MLLNPNTRSTTLVADTDTLVSSVHTHVADPLHPHGNLMNPNGQATGMTIQVAGMVKAIHSKFSSTRLTLPGQAPVSYDNAAAIYTPLLYVTSAP
jgi:hypothetical protein